MGHDPRLRRPRLRAPARLSRRRPAGPRLRPPHRPHRRSVGPQGGGAHRCPAAAALPGTRLVAGPSGEGAEAARRGAKGPLLHLHHQALSDRRRDDGHPRRGSPGGPARLLLDAVRRDLEGDSAGSGVPARSSRGGLGLVALEAGSLPRLLPDIDQGEGLPHRLRRPAPGHRHPAHERLRGARTKAACPPSSPPTATTTTLPKPASRWARCGPLYPPCPSIPPAQDSSAAAASSVCGRWRRCGTRREPGTRRPWWNAPARRCSSLQRGES